MIVTREKCTIVYNKTCHLIVIIFYNYLFIYFFLIRSFTPIRVGLFLATLDGGLVHRNIVMYDISMPLIYVDVHLKTVLLVSLFSIIV